MTYKEKQTRANERRRRFMAKLIIAGVKGGRCACGLIYLPEDVTIGKQSTGTPNTITCQRCGRVVTV